MLDEASLKVVRAIESQKVAAPMSSLSLYFLHLDPALQYHPSALIRPPSTPSTSALCLKSRRRQTDMRDRPVAGVKIAKVRPARRPARPPPRARSQQGPAVIPVDGCALVADLCREQGRVTRKGRTVGQLRNGEKVQFPPFPLRRL